MSFPSQSRRAEKLRIDRAVGRVYADAASDSRLVHAFDRLHRVVRQRSSLLAPRAGQPSLDPVVALATLARCAPRFRRPVESWSPRGRGCLAQIGSLAEHLLTDYSVPTFLARAWFASSGAGGERQRRWFVQHGRGRALRRCIDAVALTRRMEHHLLTTPHHLEPVAAIRRAEVLGLGGSLGLAKTIADSPMAAGLEH